MLATLLITASLVTGNGHTVAVSGPHVVTYEVQPGDSLWAITQRAFRDAELWPGLYAANRRTVGPDPDLIYPGQRLLLRLDRLSAPRESLIGVRAPRWHGRDGDDTTPARIPAPPRNPAGVIPSGTLSCTGLENLWMSAGGNPQAAFIAAEIAMAESGGQQYAHSPTDDYGYWQINGSHGSLATYDAYGNARAAVIISSDGTDWYPWTTYVSGAYLGRC